MTEVTPVVAVVTSSIEAPCANRFQVGCTTATLVEVLVPAAPTARVHGHAIDLR